MKKRYRLLFFLIGVVGIVLLAVKMAPSKQDWQALLTPRLPLLFAALFLLWAVIYAVHTAVYKIIIGEEGKNVSFLRMYLVCVAGFALNNVTPAGLVGGEPYRILELKAFIPTEKATSSTITFSLLYTIGHLLLWLTGSLIYLCMGCPGGTFMTVLLILAALLFLVICLYFFGKKHQGLALPAFRFFARLPLIGKAATRFAEKRSDSLSEVDRCYSEFCSDRRRLAKTALLEYSARILEGVEYFLIFLYLGQPLHLIGGIFIMSLASLIGNLLFIVPLQAGTREGGMALAMDILGLDAGTCLTGALIYRVRDLVCTAIGVLLILAGHRKRRVKKEEG